MPDLEKYPESVKLSQLHDKRMVLQEFLEWLQEQHITFGEWRVAGHYGDKFVPVHTTHDALIHQHLEIDDAKLEDERRAMLRELRKQS